MKKTPFWVYVLIGILALFFFAWIFKKLVIPYQKNKIQQLELQIQLLKSETVPIRFKILDITKDSIKVSIKFYDLDGNQISKQRFTLWGNVVSFDFVVLKADNQYIAFPDKIFTNKIAPKNGIKLYDYYEKDGYPMVYYSENMDKKTKQSIQYLYDKVKNNDIEDLKNIFGSMVQNIKEAPNFKKGNVYKIVVHTKGGIEIIQE